ncbi:hypothetical protein AVEN_260504-1 [Araneus ventricosus]|uniref:Uncharacterized protein n=1 Tax=Araneus ventricosus TaxID=182803 RepID=A0A4Y2S4R6_ARAVE|nr:hypothetical protein AVEN_260504-1 [Araneus ventricosus]
MPGGVWKKEEKRRELSASWLFAQKCVKHNKDFLFLGFCFSIEPRCCFQQCGKFLDQGFHLFLAHLWILSDLLFHQPLLWSYPLFFLRSCSEAKRLTPTFIGVKEKFLGGSGPPRLV